MSDNCFATSDVLARQLADAVGGALQRRIEEKGRACLAVSGGRTPVAFLRELSSRDLPWSKILVTLVDERWVDEDHLASNAALVREYLLRDKARSAYFLPLKNRAATPAAGFMECENRLHEQITRLDVAVLGMGEDGHTASWFPNSSALDVSLDEAGSAWCCPVMDGAPEHNRMTLTWAMLSQCQRLFLHFEGATKWQVFQRAADTVQLHDWRSMPVRRLLDNNPVSLAVYRTE
ncbi:6-phosphogluconolactonase [Parathalassolituus penaei]|uniref:6-phosphogluconolactonase n=1 Tax=Parathalassolituus penaei TaxID=2997323 RepID=A0A9X3EL42_9GAMM|nr:6-phosphogluconolactonase [Parathalassolituus penaei]MCY0964633.1 6-phosphogluconolactonase [Parathalassolituus penaei]